MKFQPSINSHFYKTDEWKRLRNQHLNKQPLCSNCNKTRNLQIDHIIAFNGDKTLFREKLNLNTLCATCHFVKTAKDCQILKLPIGDYELEFYSEQGGENFHLESSHFGWNSVLDRYVKTIIKDSHLTNKFRINYYYLGIKEIKYVIDKIAFTFKTRAKKINQKTYYEFWKEFFTVWKNQI